MLLANLVGPEALVIYSAVILLLLFRRYRKKPGRHLDEQILDEEI